MLGFSHQQCWTAALTQLYPGISASCPCLCADGSGGGGDGGELCPALALLKTGPSWAVPGHTPSDRPPGGAAAAARKPSVL